MQLAALAIVACCACGHSRQVAMRIPFCTSGRWQRSVETCIAELGTGPGLEIIGARLWETGRLSVRQRRTGMKVRLHRGSSWGLAAILAVASMYGFAPKAAAQDGVVNGQILDVTGKPWADLGIQAISDQGAKADTKTDKDGNFTFHGLRNGVYTIAIQLPAPNKPYEVKVRVSGADTPKVNLNFKDVVAKQGAEYTEQQKKQDEEQKKFQGMKAHFEAGVGFLNQAGQAKADLAKATADQRDAKKQEGKDLSKKAVTELVAAKAAAGEKDSNVHLILARLGDAYDTAGRSDDAANAYRQAIELKPSAAYYNNLGGILGRAGKIEEAMAAFQKSAGLDPQNGARAYRNGGITLYNVGKI